MPFMNLEKSLNRWCKAGLITEKQSADIIKYESEEPSASWVIFGLSGLGVSVVMIGVISLIAANWYEISSSVKLFGYFISLAALGFFAYKWDRSPGVVRESLLSAFGLFVLAGIGLIGQLYHLESDGYSALFFWLIIILPITLATESRLLNNVWFIGFAISVSMWVAASDWGIGNNKPDFSRLYIAVSLPYLFLALGYSLPKVISERFCASARFWSYVTLLVPFAMAGNIAWAHGGESEFWQHVGSLYLLPFAAAAVAIICASLRKVYPGRFLTYAICITLVASVLLSLVPLTTPIGRHEIFGCALFIAVWGGAATIAAAIERRRLFDFCALVIGIRFVVVYFQVFGSLAATGIGLIISGGVILGTAYFWHKYRGKVAKRIKEAV